jgi:hypothetical protein
MLSIKINCPCGQHFVFDVEPVNGQMPSPVKCPVCGRDETRAANEQIAFRTAGKPLPPIIPPKPKRDLNKTLSIVAGALVLLCIASAIYFVRSKQAERRRMYDSRVSQVYRNPSPPVVHSPAVVTGIGLFIVRDPQTQKFILRRTMPNSPAQQAGIPLGLILNKVDGVEVESKNITEISAMMRGQVGTTISLEFINPNTGETSQYEIARGTFENRSR